MSNYEQEVLRFLASPNNLRIALKKGCAKDLLPTQQLSTHGKSVSGRDTEEC